MARAPSTPWVLEREVWRTELATDFVRLSCVNAGDAWRRIRPALLRSLRVLTWPVTWPLWKLGLVWIRRDAQLAVMFHDGVAARYSRQLGPYHRTTLGAQVDHAVALSKQGELQQAEAELTEVIIRLNPLEDGDAKLLLHARIWHHSVLTQLGWVSESETDARFVAESYSRQLGPDHPDPLYWRELIAVALWEAERRDAAMAEMADIATRRAATQGATHPDTLKVEHILSSMTRDENVSFHFGKSAK